VLARPGIELVTVDSATAKKAEQLVFADPPNHVW
jgi:hypothetical protein